MALNLDDSFATGAASEPVFLKLKITINTAQSVAAKNAELSTENDLLQRKLARVEKQMKEAEEREKVKLQNQ